mmetsp:Transcript_20531/g.21307  ORF Transcript_20531/g.21307 Transcript_20531/m.21307 type:complete len:220 (+) Transcript_20531:21-680(+)
MNSKYLLSMVKNSSAKIQKRFMSNDLVDIVASKVRERSSMTRFGDVMVCGALGLLTFIPIVWIKNLHYKTLNLVNQNYKFPFFWGFANYKEERMNVRPAVYKPSSTDVVGNYLYERYSKNEERVLAKDIYFFYLYPQANQGLEYDSTYFFNRVKTNFDERIKLIMKEMVVKDMLNTGCTNDKNFLEKEQILNMFLSSDYKHRNELYQELLELADVNIVN